MALVVLRQHAFLGVRDRIAFVRDANFRAASSSLDQVKNSSSSNVGCHIALRTFTRKLGPRSGGTPVHLCSVNSQVIVQNSMACHGAVPVLAIVCESLHEDSKVYLGRRLEDTAVQLCPLWARQHHLERGVRVSTGFTI